MMKTISLRSPSGQLRQPFHSLGLETLECRQLLAADALCGDIRGIKWNDVNGDGVRDRNEAGIPGVTIYADLNGNGSLDRGEPSTMTLRDNPLTRVDEAGTYWLRDVPAGEQQIREVVPRGFEQTFPRRGLHIVNVEKGATVERVNFGNRAAQTKEFGSVHGTKWEDRNGNGLRDRDEPGVPGVVIYSDLNRNGEWDADEPRTTTMADDPNTGFDEAGMYWLEGLPSGVHTIREIVPDGFVQTFPDSSISPAVPDNAPGNVTTPETIAVSLSAGETHSQSVSFAFTPLCIRAFEVDVVASTPSVQLQNHTGVLTNGCGGDVSTFDISFTGSGAPQLFDLQFVDSEFGGVLATISVAISHPGDGAHTVRIGNGSTVQGIDFGNLRILPGSVHGTKWNDLNANALRDRDEPGLPGVVIYSDLNRNGALDPAEPRTTTMADDPNTDFDEAGMYWLEGLQPGNHLIREVVPDAFQQTFPPSSASPVAPENSSGFQISPETIAVSLASGETHSQSVSFAFTPLCIRAFQVDVIASTPTVQLQNHTGVLTNGCGGDVSTFDVSFTGTGVSQVFDIQFVDAEFGGVLATISVAITAPGSGAHAVRIGNGAVVEGINFGNHQVMPGSVHGTKWLDRNANGRRERDEPGLSGVTVYSDLNRNGALDQGEPSTVTMQDDPDTAFDETGMYWLEGLEPGVHVVREIVPDGFMQSFPASSVSPAIPDNGVGFEVTPETIAVSLAAGETHSQEISMAFTPLCIRAFQVDVISSSPFVQFQNHTGVLTNGCGGDISTFDISFTGVGVSQEFDVQFVDAEFGGVLATISVAIEGQDGGAHTVRIGSGSVVQGINFGNVPDNGGQSASVRGTKWRDDNGNGQRDGGEMEYGGVVIYSDLNDNRILDANEPQTTTMADDPDTPRNETGMYWLEGLRPGSHTIREVVPEGFQQTGPTNAHEVTLIPGQVVEGLDFFNQSEFRPGDANRDGFVNFADFLIVAEFFGSSDASWANGDFNGDKRVLFSDFLELVANFAQSPIRATAVDAVLKS